MKRFLAILVRLLYIIACITLIVLINFFPEILKSTNVLRDTIILACFAWFGILIMILPKKYKKTFINKLKEFELSLHDTEIDDWIADVRAVRNTINTKLKTNQTNKAYTQAKKTLCGKNCICKDLKKQDLCKECGVFKEYVKYLKDKV